MKMSKEYLEALEIECGELVEMDLLFLDRNGENQEKWHDSEAFKKAVDFEKKYGKSHIYILKQALQHLEAIDNANPSEALGLIKRTCEIYVDSLKQRDLIGYDIIEKQINEALDTIKQALIKAQEQEKVLKILKEKKVELMSLYLSSSVEQYNNQFVCDENKLTQNEFDLLKRYFNG